MRVNPVLTVEEIMQAPIAVTLARVSVLDRYLAATLGPPEGDGWIVWADAVAPGSHHLAVEMERLMARYGTQDRKVLASFLLMAYTWHIAAAATASYITERRVPDISAHNIVMRLSEDEEPRVWFLSGRFAALPSDPAARHPDMLVLPDKHCLALWLRQRLIDNLASFLVLLHEESRFGYRALWAMVADRCAEIFLWAGKAIGEQERCRVEAQIFLEAPSALWRDTPSFLEIEHLGYRGIFLRRATCCLNYKLGEARNCNTCPLLPREERARRLREAMVSEAEAGG